MRRGSRHASPSSSADRRRGGAARCVALVVRAAAACAARGAGRLRRGAELSPPGDAGRCALRQRAANRAWPQEMRRSSTTGPGSTIRCSTSLVEDALAHNKDLAAAAANLRAARAARRLAGFDQYPDGHLGGQLHAQSGCAAGSCPASISMTANSMPRRRDSTACGNSICSAA